MTKNLISDNGLIQNQVTRCEDIKDDSLYSFVHRQKIFFGLYGNYCGILVRKMKLAGGNTAECHTLQLKFRCQLKARVIAACQLITVVLCLCSQIIGPMVCRIYFPTDLGNDELLTLIPKRLLAAVEVVFPARAVAV
jgi:hypothetical protein